jgi:hypothetical protein
MKKKVFQNGTLKSKAYFMNGDVKQEVEEAVYEGTTPLSAENLNDMQDNIEEEINSHIEHKYFLQLTADIAKGGTITLPCYYKVETHCLDVYYMGELLTLSSDDAGTDGHYREVGEANSVSNQIKTTSDWGCDVGEYFEIVVRGEYSA